MLFFGETRRCERSGEIVILLGEIIEEGFNTVYFEIPHTESYEGFSDMSDFAATVADEELRDALYIALNQKRKVFRHFKDTLAADTAELERYTFTELRNRERVTGWLRSIGFNPVVE